MAHGLRGGSVHQDGEASSSTRSSESLWPWVFTLWTANDGIIFKGLPPVNLLLPAKSHRPKVPLPSSIQTMSLGDISTHILTSFMNCDSLGLPFASFCVFISFAYLAIQSKACKTMADRSSNWGCPSLASDWLMP